MQQGTNAMRPDSYLQTFTLATLFTLVAATWVALGQPANNFIQPISIQVNETPPWPVLSF